MDLYPPTTEADADEVDPGSAHLATESRDVESLGPVNGVDGIAWTGGRPHFDGDSSVTVSGDEVDLTVVHGHIASLDD